MQNLLSELTALLATDDRLVSDGVLLRNKIVELALNVDPPLLKRLMSNDSIRQHFFTQVEDVLVFDKHKFQRFVGNKAFLPDSYTSFKNKIGLAVDGSYLADAREVVLVWPYKDCVLEGGQDREDAARDEIFWNETLAPDQIDRLLAPKALTNFNKYTTKGVEKAASVSSQSDNLIIRGNNLLALHSLAASMAGSVKLIYIDPPYNTENDSFGYNDKFTHSTWLTFMRNRLEIAHRLLSDDGIMFVSLDDKEAHYCKVMMDSVFGRENFVADICHKARASVSNDKIISSSHNHLLFYAKKERVVYAGRSQFGIKNDLTGFTLNDGVDDYKLVPVDGPGGAAKGNPFYKFLGVEGYWRFSRETMEAMHKEKMIVKTGNTLMQKLYKSKAALSKKTVTTWWDEGFLTSTATNDLNKLMGEAVFKNPKSVALLKRIIELWTVEGDTVLDFFAGSGTTAHAALELSREDGIRRRFILCEQLEYEAMLPASRVRKVLSAGDSFVECELAKANEVFIDRIKAAGESKALSAIWEEMKERAFLSYKVDVAEIDVNKGDVGALSLEEKRRFLVEVLDKNMMYVPLSEIEDDSFAISEKDRRLNAQFYRKQ